MRKSHQSLSIELNKVVTKCRSYKLLLQIAPCELALNIPNWTSSWCQYDPVIGKCSHFVLSVIFETLAIHSGSKKHVDSIYVHVQIQKYLQYKLGIAENCIITHASSLHHINVSYCEESKL